jgi:hypothetical protein
VLASLAAVVIAGFAGVSTGATPWPPTEAAFEGGEHEAEEHEAEDDEEGGWEHEDDEDD